MTVFYYIWKKLAAINLTIFLCLLLAADLSFGYVCLNRNADLFEPLNDVGLIPWMSTYGRSSPENTAWFMILLILLTLLCINTFVCTTDRVARLIKHRSGFSAGRLFFRFAPHIMHYALIIILSGYLCSYAFSHVLDTRTLIPGACLNLPGTKARIKFQSFEPEYFEKDRMPAFKGHVIRPLAVLLLICENGRREAKISYNKPVIFKNYGIFLRNFTPKQKSGGMDLRVRIDLSIRRDPGVILYMIGMLLFTAGIVMYLTNRIYSGQGKKEG